MSSHDTRRFVKVVLCLIYFEMCRLFDKLCTAIVTFKHYADLFVASMSLVPLCVESLKHIITLMESAYKCPPTGGLMRNGLYLIENISKHNVKHISKTKINSN